ncbi:MAG: ATPase domain-containing protein [Euryarchaeota archaeon]|nr:ATPase domain-containing protein [Euryarchaeota archaeon]
MPFDLPKVTAALALPFLATSLYFTVEEHPNFIIYQNIPYIFVIAFLLPVFLGTILIFTYLNTISAKTKLKYWEYLKYGLSLHIIVTFYVFSLIFLLWNNATSSTKMLCTVLVLIAFVFYLSFAQDLRTILKDQNIKPIIGRLDFPLYLVFFCSIFSLIFFGISFTYGKASGLMGIEFISYPAILFFIFFFLIAFGAYLSVTHKGFEEIMRKNIWSELSYIFAFIVFLLVYLIYTSLNTHLQRFPYHNFAFIGYFAVLIIEIASTSTLAEKFKYTKAGREDIVHLLNLHAHHFLRTDYLEGLWEQALDRYVTGDEVKKIRFDPSKRRFDLEETDEKTRVRIAVGILLGMQKLPNVEKITILRKSIEEMKEDITAILEEKILLLPDDLRSEFDESVYYPILYERAIDDLLTPLETFIPFTEQANIFERLKRRDERFKRIRFEVDKIRISEEARFSRAGFLELFRLYLDAVEEKFPFKRLLLYELVRETIKMELEQYNITVGEVLNMVPTGLEEMDKIMAGGLVKGSTTLLITEETKMKQKILLSFIKQGLVEGNSAIYATSKRPFQQIVGELLMDVEALKNFVIIDLYKDLYAEGRVSELVEEEHRIIAPLSKILFQRSIVKTIKSQPRDVPKIVIGDVYDDFSRYYSTKEIFELLQNQIEGLKRWNCTSVIVLDPHSYLITREGVEEVKKHFDNVLILSGEEKDASVLVEKLYHGTPSKNVVRLHL